MGIGSADGPTWGEYNMSGNATFSAPGLNGASTVYSFTITGHLGKSKLTMTDTATANIGSLTLKPLSGAAAKIELSGQASLTIGKIGNGTDGYTMGAGCYIDFVSGSLATLTITGTHDFTNLVSAGSIRVDGIAQSDFSSFTVTGNTLSLVAATLTTSAHPTPILWLNQYYGVTNYDDVAEVDTDGDGMTAWEEYISGTDPTNKQSSFRLLELTKVGVTNVVVWLGGNTNLPPFAVWVSSNLSAGAGGWTRLATQARSMDGTNFWYDDTSATSDILRYYKVVATNAL
jgi:hypothetical protein